MSFRHTITAALLFLAVTARTLKSEPLRELEGALHAFPALYNLNGQKFAEGEFTQWLEEDGRLRVTIIFTFGDGRRIEERARFQQQPDLVQEDWSWRETRKDQLLRQFSIDFGKGKAAAEKLRGSELKRWAADVKIVPGKTFAGFGFTLALKSRREQLLAGRTIELQAVGFIPAPHSVSVELSFAGADSVPMAGRTISGDCFVIHPKIPWLARSFVTMEDTKIWLTNPRPAGFLRWEGPLLEPSDMQIRVDLLPAAQSSPVDRALSR